jgi:hypothetical protein
MPDIFKALASIMAWGLWIGSWVMLICTLTAGFMNDKFFGSEALPMVFPALFAVSLALGVGSVVVMVLRKKMEK